MSQVVSHNSHTGTARRPHAQNGTVAPRSPHHNRVASARKPPGLRTITVWRLRRLHGYSTEIARFPAQPLYTDLTRLAPKGPYKKSHNARRQCEHIRRSPQPPTMPKHRTENQRRISHGARGKCKLMPGSHLPRTPCDNFNYDFPCDLGGIVGGYWLRHMCSHCLRASCNIFYGASGATIGNSVQRLCGDCTHVKVQNRELVLNRELTVKPRLSLQKNTSLQRAYQQQTRPVVQPASRLERVGKRLSCILMMMMTVMVVVVMMMMIMMIMIIIMIIIIIFRGVARTFFCSGGCRGQCMCIDGQPSVYRQFFS